MKKITSFILLNTFLFAGLNPELDDYQKKYTLCNGQTNLEVAECFLNTEVDYSKVRADYFDYIRMNPKEIEEAENNNEIYEYVMSILPQTTRYQSLKNYLDFLYSIEDEYEEPHFTFYEKQYTNSENIRKTKKILNLLQDSNLEENDYYDDEMIEAIEEFQRRHGFIVNGKLWKETREELNKPLGQIILKVKKNLEIERSLGDKEGTYVYINIPEFKMYYYKDDELQIDMNVVVGKTKMRTPIFKENLKYIVKNPRWNVPDSIYNKEYRHWSTEKLERKGFAYTKDGKLYQKSGNRNALGLVKFLFPNTYNVYMHDTPSKGLFKNRVRAYSHGCIRLEKPFEFLNSLGYYYDTKKTKWITLEEKIPVNVEYHTVWIDENGNAQFRNDIYNYEHLLFN